MSSWGFRLEKGLGPVGLLRSVLVGVLLCGVCWWSAPAVRAAAALASAAGKEGEKKGEPKDKAKEKPKPKDKEGAKPEPKKKDPEGDGDGDDDDPPEPDDDEADDASDEGRAPGGDGDKSKTVVKPSSPDEAFVRENLKDILGPTTMKFLEDGRVQMTFDFKAKSDDHSGIFTPIVGNALKDTFRWSINDEEWVVGGEAGLRLSNQGIALMNCWYTDDVEVEVQMLQHIAHTQKHIMALIFCNDQGKAIGTNYGCQVSNFTQGRPAGFRGKADPINFEAVAKVKFVVRGGECQGFREGRPREKMSYGKKSFASGRLGFAWGGSIAGTVTNFEVKGKIDYARMAKEMRRTKKK